ncbi:MAG: hypothetical protein R3281_06050 [Balneolaceae bacterium]|nr:hypothetical protein [Balneolaceae bacterium]
MIAFHRPDTDDPYSDQIKEKLEEMVVAHNVHRHDPSADEKLPYCRENDRIFSGKQEIEQYLQELERELREQRMVTSDSCYIDPETGEIC